MPLKSTRASFVLSFDSSDRRWNKKQSVCSDLSMAGFFERPERIRSVFYLRLASVVPAIERIGIFSQNLFFGALRNVLAATDRRHDMRKHRIPMRIIGGKNDSVLADPLDNVGKHPFFRLGGEEPVAVNDILAGLLLTQRRFHIAALFPFFVHAFHPVRNPTSTTFEKCNPQLGEPLRDAGVHQAYALNDGLRRAAYRMHVDEAIEAILTSRPLAPAVHTKGNVEPLDLFIDRPERLRAEMFPHSLRSDGDTDQSQLGHRAFDLFHRRIHVLKRQQRHRFESRTLLANCRDEIVVSPRVSDRVVTLEDFAHGKAGGGKQYRDIDAFAIHVPKARRHIMAHDITETSSQPGVHS